MTVLIVGKVGNLSVIFIRTMLYAGKYLKLLLSFLSEVMLCCDRTESVDVLENVLDLPDAGCDGFRLRSPVVFTFPNNKVLDNNPPGAGVLPMRCESRSRRSTSKSLEDPLSVVSWSRSYNGCLGSTL